MSSSIECRVSVITDKAVSAFPSGVSAGRVDSALLGDIVPLDQSPRVESLDSGIKPQASAEDKRSGSADGGI